MTRRACDEGMTADLRNAKQLDGHVSCIDLPEVALA